MVSKSRGVPVSLNSLVEISTGETETSVEPVPIFKIDDTVYTMPGTVSASVALKMLDVARRQGQEASMSWVMEEVLGQEAYTALMNCKQLTTKQLTAIMEHLETHVMGAIEEGK